MVKLATYSYSTRFAALLQDKLHVFCCPFFRTFRSARRSYAPLRNSAEITVRMCERISLIQFGFLAGAKAVRYNLNIAFNSNCGMLENGLALLWYEYHKKNQLSVCLRTFRDKCLFSHDVWCLKEEVISGKKCSTDHLLALLWLNIDPSLLYLRCHFSRNNRQQMIISNIESSNDLPISIRNIKKRVQLVVREVLIVFQS